MASVQSGIAGGPATNLASLQRGFRFIYTGNRSPQSQPTAMAASIRNWLSLSLLGTGSFASVSLALNLDDGLLFAVKSIDCSSAVQLLALQNELHFLQSLDSPRILHCLGSDSSAENGSAARNLFLEYMPEGSIADMVKKSGGKLDESRVRSYTRAILEGLQYLHEQGIVHGDIKGQNILLGSTGVKIGDFGSATRMSSSTDGVTRPEPRLLQGTPLWMAPELVQGVEQGPPSDIWSLGCTVVEMLQGRPPWSNSSNLAAVLYTLGCSEEEPPLPVSVCAEARDFLQKCLHRDPMARWTAAQLLEHSFVKEQPEAAGCDFPRHRGQLSPRSTLDYGSESDWEEESASSVHNLSLPTGMKANSVTLRTSEADDSIYSKATYRPRMLAIGLVESDIPVTEEWITVRRAEGWSENRQKPFMEALRGVGFADLERLRMASQVNWDSVAFLKNRACGKRS